MKLLHEFRKSSHFYENFLIYVSEYLRFEESMVDFSRLSTHASKANFATDLLVFTNSFVLSRSLDGQAYHRDG